MNSVGSDVRSEVLAQSSNNYFSLDDILASQEKIPLTLKQDIPQLGFLDPQSHHQTDPTILMSGTKLEVPLWMAKDFKNRGRAKLELPPTWNLRQRQITSADPNVLNLHKLGPHFYQTGCHILKHISEGQNLDNEADAISNILVDTLTKRFRGIMDASANAEAQDTLINTGKCPALKFKGATLGYSMRFKSIGTANPCHVFILIILNFF
jgi:GINS complex subunit 3